MWVSPLKSNPANHTVDQCVLSASGLKWQREFIVISSLLGCNCDSDFTDGTCEDLTGRCYCKPNYTGEHCDSCADGYVEFPHCYRTYCSHSP